MPVQFVANQANCLPHGKSCKDGADPKPFQMPKKNRRHSGGNGQADHVKCDLDFGIGDASDLRKFPWE